MTQNNTDSASDATNVQKGNFTITDDTRVLFSMNKAGTRYTGNTNKPETPVAKILKITTENGESIIVADLDTPLGDPEAYEEMKGHSDSFDATRTGTPLKSVEECGVLTIQDILEAKTRPNNRGLKGTHAPRFDQTTLSNIASGKFKVGDAPKI